MCSLAGTASGLLHSASRPYAPKESSTYLPAKTAEGLALQLPLRVPERKFNREEALWQA